MKPLGALLLALTLACEPPPSDEAAPADGGVVVIQQAATCGGPQQPPCVGGGNITVTSNLRVDHGNNVYRQLQVWLPRGRFGYDRYIGPNMRWATNLQCWTAATGVYDCGGSPPLLQPAVKLTDELSSYRTGTFCVLVTLGWGDCVVDRQIGVSASTWTTTWGAVRNIGRWVRVAWRLARSDGVWCGGLPAVAYSDWVDTEHAPFTMTQTTEQPGPMLAPMTYLQPSIACGENLSMWIEGQYTICGPGGRLPSWCQGWPSLQNCPIDPRCGGH